MRIPPAKVVGMGCLLAELIQQIERIRANVQLERGLSSQDNFFAVTGSNLAEACFDRMTPINYVGSVIPLNNTDSLAVK